MSCGIVRKTGKARLKHWGEAPFCSGELGERVLPSVVCSTMAYQTVVRNYEIID
jgi:hypothetical protein